MTSSAVLLPAHVCHRHQACGPDQGGLVRGGDGTARWIGRDAAVAILGVGGLPCSASEAAMLRIAARLGGGIPVHLRAALDQRSICLVAAAVVHASAGSR
jgi:hypothetical protein